MPDEKRHHYHPELLLKGFCHEGKLWVFDREANALRPQTPKNTAVETHLYCRNEKDKHDTSLEEFLSYIETKATTPLAKLAERQVHSLEERYYLSLFLALLCVRGPHFHKAIRELVDKSGKALLKEMHRRGALEPPEKRGLDPNAVRDFIENERFQIDPGKDYVLGMMVSGAVEKVGREFFVAAWSVLETSTDCCFITADVPYYLFSADPTKPAGLAAPLTIRAIPLDATRCVMIGPGPASLEFDKAPRDLVREINRGIATRADRFIFARDRAQLASLAARCRLSESRQPARVQVQTITQDDKTYIISINKDAFPGV